MIQPMILALAMMGQSQAVTVHPGETFTSVCVNLPPHMKCSYELKTAVPPLKCGKYQHVEMGWDANGRLVNGCVDDMHTVTEREWQELMQRLKKLETK